MRLLTFPLVIMIQLDDAALSNSEKDVCLFLQASFTLFFLLGFFVYKKINQYGVSRVVCGLLFCDQSHGFPWAAFVLQNIFRG